MKNKHCVITSICIVIGSLLFSSCSNLAIENSSSVLENNQSEFVKLQAIDDVYNGFFHAVVDDHKVIISKCQDSNVRGPVVLNSVNLTIDAGPTTKFFSFDGETQESNGNLPSMQGLIFPYYINPAGEVYFTNSYDSLFLENTEESLVSLNDTFGTLITKGKFKPWVLFHKVISLDANEYVLYNMDTHEWYTFSFDYRIRECYFYDHKLIIAWDDPLENSWELTYTVYEIETWVIYSTSFRKGNTLEEIEGHVISELPGTVQLVNPEGSGNAAQLRKISPPLSIPFQAEIISFYPKTNELVWLSDDRSNILVTDCVTGKNHKTLLTDEIISQYIPFISEENYGFWVVPLMTSIAESEHIYLFKWVNNEIRPYKYSIGTHFFEKNAFVTSCDQLSIVTNSTSSQVSQYNYLVLDPTNETLYHQYPLYIDSPIVGIKGPLYFEGFPSLPNQTVISISSDMMDSHYPTHFEGLYMLHFIDSDSEMSADKEQQLKNAAIQTTIEVEGEKLNRYTYPQFLPIGNTIQVDQFLGESIYNLKFAYLLNQEKGTIATYVVETSKIKDSEDENSFHYHLVETTSPTWLEETPTTRVQSITQDGLGKAYVVRNHYGENVNFQSLKQTPVQSQTLLDVTMHNHKINREIEISNGLTITKLQYLTDEGSDSLIFTTKENPDTITVGILGKEHIEEDSSLQFEKNIIAWDFATDTLAVLLEDYSIHTYFVLSRNDIIVFQKNEILPSFPAKPQKPAVKVNPARKSFVIWEQMTGGNTWYLSNYMPCPSWVNLDITSYAILTSLEDDRSGYFTKRKVAIGNIYIFVESGWQNTKFNFITLAGKSDENSIATWGEMGMQTTSEDMFQRWFDYYSTKPMQDGRYVVEE